MPTTVHDGSKAEWVAVSGSVQLAIGIAVVGTYGGGVIGLSFVSKN